MKYLRYGNICKQYMCLCDRSWRNKYIFPYGNFFRLLTQRKKICEYKQQRTGLIVGRRNTVRTDTFILFAREAMQ